VTGSRTRKGKLTELEGAILAAVRRGEGVTPYRLRQAFAASPSMEWSGSAGAVYPAMRRLKAAGLLAATASHDDGRGTESYRLTKAGTRALFQWSSDVARSVSAGSDPFRSRAPEWLLLAPGKRRPVFARIEKAVQARCRAVKAQLPKLGRIEREQAALELELQRARLRWIAKHR
jgi:DNA-binding PadR family transcriptional regulator